MANDITTALENYDRFAYARDNGHLDFVEKAETCDAYFHGAQWQPETIARLERLGKPVITLNKVLSSCATVFGEQLANRSDVSFRPARDGVAETADALDKVWLHIALGNDLNWLESEMAADGFIRGRGFIDVRINFDDHLMGEVRLRSLNSKSVVIDPDADTYDPDGWSEVFVTKWLTGMDVARLYGSEFGAEVRGRPLENFVTQYDTVDWMPDNFGGLEHRWSPGEDRERRRMFRVIERQHKEMRWAELLVDPNTGDMREIPPTWSRNRTALVAQTYGLVPYRKRIQGIRWVVSLDNILLHDAVSPYKHFTPVPYFPFFRHGTTVGIVENLISPQDLLNKSISQELHIVNTTANSGWVMRANVLANMTPEQLEERGGEDGLVIEVNGSPSDIVKIKPNQVPTGLDRLSFKADEGLKEVSMVSDSMRGFDRADVAARAIEAKQHRGAISLAKPFDNLGFTRKLTARNVLDLVQSFYTEERVLNITGGNLNDEPEQLVVNQVTPEGRIVNDLTLGEYSVVINTVPARQNAEDSQFSEALELRKLGIAIPDDVLVEHSHLNRKTDIAARIKAINGGGEPSEAEQRLRELEVQLKEIEAKEKESNVLVKQTNAELNRARAQKALQEEPKKDNGQEAELLKLALERERAAAELALKREEIEKRLELDRRKLENSMELERQRLLVQIDMDKRKRAAAEKLAQQEANERHTESAQKAE